MLKTTKHHEKGDLDDDKEKKQRERLMEVSESFRGCIDLEVEIVDNHLLHDRQIVFDNGWKVKIGRGLDIYKHGRGSSKDRPCRETIVDIMCYRDAVEPQSATDGVSHGRPVIHSKKPFTANVELDDILEEPDTQSDDDCSNLIAKFLCCCFFFE